MKVDHPRFNKEDGFVDCCDCPWEEDCCDEPCPTSATYDEACRLAEQSNKGESDDTAALREKHKDMWGY